MILSTIYIVKYIYTALITIYIQIYISVLDPSPKLCICKLCLIDIFMNLKLNMLKNKFPIFPLNLLFL